jgi:MFS family permease
MTEPRRPFLAIAVLDATSLLAQIGQYGIAFVLFPLALQARGVAAWQIGVVSSALWLGMLVGLLMAPSWVARHGHLATLLAGLADATGLRGLALGVTAATLAAALLSTALIAHALQFVVPTFVPGGLMSSFLTLGIIAATLADHPEQLDAEVSRVSIAYAALAAIGPVAAGALVTLGGPGLLMGFVGVWAALLGLSLCAFRSRA